jgi:ATP synthase protein I
MGGTVLRGLAYFTQVGVVIAACVLIGVFLGKFLDARFGTYPWLLLAFSFLGVAAAFREIFAMANKRNDPRGKL